MPCLALSAGDFMPRTFGIAPLASVDGTLTITINALGITIRRTPDNSFINHASPGGSSTFWAFFGSHYAVILDQDQGGGASTVYLVTTSGPTIGLKQVFQTPNANTKPVFATSQGMTMDAFFIYGVNRITSENVGMQIYASPDGAFLHPKAGSGLTAIPATNQLLANYTASKLSIHTSTGMLIGGSGTMLAGISVVTTGSGDFPDTVIGTGAPAALATSTKTFTITNTGNNCIKIAPFVNVAPFNVLSTSQPLPFTINPGGTPLIVTVQFAPAAISSTPYKTNLDINFDSAFPVGAGSDKILACKGTARAPKVSITDNVGGSYDFGSVAVPGPSNKNIRITNDGEIDLVLNMVSANGDANYDWTAPAVNTLLLAGAFVDIMVTFKPQTIGTHPAQMQITASPGGISQTIHFFGSGCIATAGFVLPSQGPVDFGSVQQGFHTVRMFKVVNAGSGPLQFTARIEPSLPGDATSEAEASMYGAWPGFGDITKAGPSFDSLLVLPVTPCGSVMSGTGEYNFGITFFAAAAPALTSAKLHIINYTDPSQPRDFFISLSALITAQKSVDVELVLDKSASMAEASGIRTKVDSLIDAAQLFVELMRPDVGDRIGIVSFDTTAVQIQPLTTVTTASQPVIAANINTTTLAPLGDTSIAGGLLTALRDMSTHGRPVTVIPNTYNSSIIVLTDGLDNTPYLNPRDNQYYSLLGGTEILRLQNGAQYLFVPTIAVEVPSYRKIYAIGIGDNIDVAKLGTLAESSGGSFLQVTDLSGNEYFALEKSFTQIYLEGADYSPIIDPVFHIRPQETQSHTFVVATGDISALVVVYDKDGIRLPFYIISPSGETIDPVSVAPGFQIRPGSSPTGRFIEIIMPSGEPERYAGTWTVLVHHTGTACRFPEKTARDQRFTREVLFYGFQPTGCTPDFRLQQMYGISIGVRSGFRMKTRFVAPFVSAGEPIRSHVTAHEFGLLSKDFTVTVKIKKPDGTLSEEILNRQNGWALSFAETSHEGHYSFEYTLTAKTGDGNFIQRQETKSIFVQGRQKLVSNLPTAQPELTIQKKILPLIYILILLIIVIILIMFFK